jgi:hypothetical protein
MRRSTRSTSRAATPATSRHSPSPCTPRSARRCPDIRS